MHHQHGSSPRRSNPNLRDGATLPKIAEVKQTAWLSALHRRRMRNRASCIGVLQIARRAAPQRLPNCLSVFKTRSPDSEAFASRQVSLGNTRRVSPCWTIRRRTRLQKPHRTDSRASHGGAGRLGPPSTSAGSSTIALAGSLRSRAFGLALHSRSRRPQVRSRAEAETGMAR